MITRQSWTTLVLGTLAGAGLGAGALTLAKRSGAGCCGAASQASPTECSPTESSPAGVACSDGGSTAALTTLAKSGPADGRWSYQDSSRSMEQVLSRDPSDAGVLHFRSTRDPAAGTKTLPLEVIARALFGNVERFLKNYAPCEAASMESIEGREMLRVRWCSLRGGPAPERDVWLDAITRELLRVEDRTSDGHLIRRLRFAVVAPGQIIPPVPGAAAQARASLPALSNRSVPAFDEFVGRVDIPVYEPAELPPGYERTQFAYENRATDEKGAALRVVWIGYDEGVMQMNLFIAPPADMGRLEAIARMASVKNSGSGAAGQAGAGSATASPVAGCASMPVDTPEDVIESEGSVTVRVRSDGCRIVVRRDDLPGVAIALVGSAATPRESYIRAIRNLVLVAGRAASGHESTSGGK